MAFPTTGVIDDFNRADTGPPPSGSWGGGISTASSSLKVSSNGCVDDNSGGDGGVYGTSFGPDSEVFATLSTPQSNFSQTEFHIRLVNDGSSSVNGYRFRYSRDDGNPGGTASIYRLDAGAYTQLGFSFSDTSGTLSAGDKLGMDAVGSAITAYRFRSSWASLLSRTDSTYNAAGKIGMAPNKFDSEVIDDFGGGSIAVAAPPPRLPLRIPNPNVGPPALRIAFRQPYVPVNVPAPAAPAPIPVVPLRIPTGNVGPAALRYTFRQPYRQPDIPGPGPPEQTLAPPVRIATGNVGPVALRYTFRPPYVPLNVPAPGPPEQTPATSFRVPNAQVGPPALRLTFRQPYVPQTAAAVTGGGDVTIFPTAGDLVLSAAAATPVITVTPPAGNLVLSAAAATAVLIVTPPAGNLTLSAGTATVVLTVTPPAGNLVLSAAAPFEAVTVAPSVGNLTLSAAAATAALNLSPPAGNLVLSAATALPGLTTAPTAGNLALAAGTQTVRLTLTPSAGNLVLSGDAVTITGGTGATVTLTPQNRTPFIVNF